MAKFNEERIKETNLGFNYVEVTPYENISWGGYCVCNGCNNQFENENMNLVYVLGDTYCNKCFTEWVKRTNSYDKEDIDYDLRKQKQDSLDWYKYHLDSEFRREVAKRNRELEEEMYSKEDIEDFEAFIRGILEDVSED